MAGHKETMDLMRREKNGKAKMIPDLQYQFSLPRCNWFYCVPYIYTNCKDDLYLNLLLLPSTDDFFLWK